MKDDKYTLNPSDIGRREFKCVDECSCGKESPTHQEVTDRINALASALSALNESMGSLPLNSKHVGAIHLARLNVASELALLTSNTQDQPHD